MRAGRPLLVVLFIALCGPLAAEAPVSAQESQAYFFGLMQKGQSFSVDPGDAGDYLRGVWRLDRKAHYGEGHYVEAGRGDDVYVICNDTRLVQVDFNRDQREFIEIESELAKLKVEEDGSFSFGTRRMYRPLDDNHLVVTAYDYIAILERASGRTQQPDTDAGSAD